MIIFIYFSSSILYVKFCFQCPRRPLNIFLFRPSFISKLFEPMSGLRMNTIRIDFDFLSLTCLNLSNRQTNGAVDTWDCCRSDLKLSILSDHANSFLSKFQFCLSSSLNFLNWPSFRIRIREWFETRCHSNLNAWDLWETWKFQGINFRLQDNSHSYLIWLDWKSKRIHRFLLSRKTCNANRIQRLVSTLLLSHFVHFRSIV